MLVDLDAFAAATELLAAGVAVLATSVRGVDHAITVTSYTWVSRGPPLLVVSVHEDARLLDAVDESGMGAVARVARAPVVEMDVAHASQAEKRAEGQSGCPEGGT